MFVSLLENLLVFWNRINWKETDRHIQDWPVKIQGVLESSLLCFRWSWEIKFTILGFFSQVRYRGVVKIDPELKKQKNWWVLKYLCAKESKELIIFIKKLKKRQSIVKWVNKDFISRTINKPPHTISPLETKSLSKTLHPF